MKILFAAIAAAFLLLTPAAAQQCNPQFPPFAELNQRAADLGWTDTVEVKGRLYAALSHSLTKFLADSGLAGTGFETTTDSVVVYFTDADPSGAIVVEKTGECINFTPYRVPADMIRGLITQAQKMMADK